MNKITNAKYEIKNEKEEAYQFDQCEKIFSNKDSIKQYRTHKGRSHINVANVAKNS